MENIERIKKADSLLSKKSSKFSNNNLGLIGNLNTVICIQDFFDWFYLDNSNKIGAKKLNNEYIII